MARSRMITPEFFLDEGLAELSANARLLYIGLWQIADDINATLPNRPKWIKAQVFPYETVKIESLLEELTKHNKLLPFEHENETYLFIKNFRKHQRVDKPSTIRKYPEYSGSTTEPLPYHSFTPLDQVKKRRVEKSRVEIPKNSKNSLTPCNDQELQDVADSLKVSVDAVKRVHQTILDSIADGTFQKKRYGQTVYFTLRKWVNTRLEEGKLQTVTSSSIKGFRL